MIERYIYKMNVNPFFCSQIFQAFYHGYGKDSCSILLHYLVLPHVMYSDTRIVLTELTIRSTLAEVISRNKVAFIDLQRRVDSMRKLSNLSLMNLHCSNKIELKSDVLICDTIDYSGEKEEQDYFKAAHYLGVLFGKEDTVEIFKQLKVIP